jgi:hypothetical protein
MKIRRFMKRNYSAKNLEIIILTIFSFQIIDNSSLADTNNLKNYLFDSCGKNAIMTKYEKDEPAKCRNLPELSGVELSFPFASDQVVKCTQGNLEAKVSHHDFYNIQFAVDLATKRDLPPGNVYAANDGIAMVYNDCDYRYSGSDTQNSNMCGDGWGNHVRILRKDGLLTFYVHLSNIFIKTGQKVKTGDLIGVEGTSGLAGHRHLHFSAHYTKHSFEELSKEPSWTEDTIPFKFKLRYSDREKVEKVPSTELRCDIDNDADTKPPFIFGEQIK